MTTEIGKIYLKKKNFKKKSEGNIVKIINEE